MGSRFFNSYWKRGSAYGYDKFDFVMKPPRQRRVGHGLPAGQNRIGEFGEKKGCFSFVITPHLDLMFDVIRSDAQNSPNRKELRTSIDLEGT